MWKVLGVMDGVSTMLKIAERLVVDLGGKKKGRHRAELDLVQKKTSYKTRLFGIKLKTFHMNWNLTTIVWYVFFSKTRLRNLNGGNIRLPAAVKAFLDKLLALHVSLSLTSIWLHKLDTTHRATTFSSNAAYSLHEFRGKQSASTLAILFLLSLDLVSPFFRPLSIS